MSASAAETGSGLVSVAAIKMWQHPTKKIEQLRGFVVSKAIGEKISEGGEPARQTLRLEV